MPIHFSNDPEEDFELRYAPFHHEMRMVLLEDVGGNRFWGCAKYPECRYTEEFDNDFDNTDDFWWVRELDEPGDK